MQPLTGAPRQSLGAAVVTNLLQNDPNIQIVYGARYLDTSLNVLGDLSPWMSSGSSIASDSNATIHRTLTLKLDSNNPVAYGSNFVQPFMTIKNPDNGDTASFNLGVYTLATPQWDNSNLPSVLSLTGYDLLYYVNQVIGDSVSYAKGTNPITAVQALIAAAFPGAIITATPTTSVLAAAMAFPFNSSTQSTYLQVINVLLASAGYQPVWVDWNGTFQLQPYITPSNTAIEWTFDMTSPTNIVAEQRTSQQDLFTVPNTWQFVMTNLTVAPLEGATQFTYVDSSANNPGSTVNRKRTIKKTLYVAAADYASLVQYGMSIVVQDLSPAETFNVTTSPFPLAWQFDQIWMIDPNLASVPPTFLATRRVQAMTWSLDLDGQQDMSWTWQTVFA